MMNNENDCKYNENGFHGFHFEFFAFLADIGYDRASFRIVTV